MTGVDRRAVVLGMTAASAGLPRPARARSARPPNILMIVTDQEFGFGSFPAGLLQQMPNHQALLARGVSLSRYNVHTAPCSASRSNIFTGRHTQTTGIVQNIGAGQAPLSEKLPTLGHMMRAAGYYTSYKGKWHLSAINEERNWNNELRANYPSTADSMERYGFSDYNFDGQKLELTWGGYGADEVIAAEAARAILDYAEKDKAGGKPWFQVVGLINPHDIMFFDATGRQSQTRLSPNLYAPMKEAQGDPLFAERLNYGLPNSFYKDDLSTKPQAHRLINAEEVGFFGALPREDTESWNRYANYYYNCLRDADRHLRNLLWALKASGQDENTIVIFTADHGERGGAHGMRQKGGTMYKEEVNVPFVVVHPDGAKGAVSDGLMGAVDIAPTLLALAGKDRNWSQERFAGLVGVDVSGLVAEPGVKTERDRRGHLFNYVAQQRDLSRRMLLRGVHDGRYKFARYFAAGQHHTPKDWRTLLARNDLELYDTHADPDEVTNLAAEPAAHRATIMRLNGLVNQLVQSEVGADNGGAYPPPLSQYNNG